MLCRAADIEYYTVDLNEKDDLHFAFTTNKVTP